MLADRVILAGFGLQLVFLALVDAGTLISFARQAPPWYHPLGLLLTNIVLLGLSALILRWIREPLR